MTLASLDHWTSCTRCGLHRYRRHVVLGRGVIPAPYLFVGEAPGPTEDLRALAFVGKAGRIFRKALALAARMATMPLPPRHYITNVVACLPHDGLRDYFRAPEHAEIIACRPRLVETIRVVQPEYIILLGKVAQKECKALCPDGFALRHPSYLRRTGGVEGPDFQKFVRELSAFWEETCRPEWIPRGRSVN